MAGPVVTGTEVGSTGATTVQVPAPDGMQAGNKLLVGFRSSANLASFDTDPIVNGGSFAANRRAGFLPTIALDPGDAPFTLGVRSAESAGVRYVVISYDPGDEDIAPIWGGWSTNPGEVFHSSFFRQTEHWHDSLYVMFGSTQSSNSSWTPPEGLIDAGLYQPGFTNPAVGAYVEGVNGPPPETLSYSFAGSMSSPNYSIPVVVPGSSSVVPMPNAILEQISRTRLS